MASLPHSKTVTYEEWLRMPEVKGEEVVDGEIRIMPAPKSSHTQIVQNTYDIIRPQVDNGAVWVVNSPFDLIIRRAPLTARQPDIAVFQRSTILERDGRIFSPPQLIVEVLSPGNTPRDWARKLADYASLGVPEVWSMYPDDRAVEVLYLEDGQYRCHARLTGGILRPKLFPDVEVPISEIWPE